MNTIAEQQNTPKQLQRLAAQRYLYWLAKRIFGIQILLSVPVVIVLAFMVFLLPDLKHYVALWGLFLVFVDTLWLNPWLKRLRERAARIQEAFDCDVLEMAWNDCKAGSRIDPEFVKEHADKYAIVASQFTPISNWYPLVVKELPIEVARAICQRANCWWDAAQRRRYAGWVIAGLMIMSVLIVVLGFISGFTVEKLFIVVIAPLSPAVILGIREYAEHMEAARRLDKLKEHSEKLWEEACSHQPVAELTQKSRALQDEIFENRKRSPLVFEWIYRRLRRSHEMQMNHAAEELVDEAKRKLGLK